MQFCALDVEEGGYLDYAMICKEMDELMKSAPDEGATRNIFAYHATVRRDGVPCSQQRYYFMDVQERVMKSASGPKNERIALYIVCDSMMDKYFYPGCRAEMRNSEQYNTFHDRMKFVLENFDHLDECSWHELFHHGLSLSVDKRHRLERCWSERDHEHESTSTLLSHSEQDLTCCSRVWNWLERLWKEKRP